MAISVSGRVGLFKTNLMERPPMTDDMMIVRSLVEKNADADIARDDRLCGFAAERLIELGVGRATGAGYDEKNPLRLAQQRRPRPGLGDTGWNGRASHSEAAQKQLFPELS